MPAPTYSKNRREALCAWLEANNIAANHVPIDSDFVIEEEPDGRYLRCELFDLDAEGRKQLDERRNTAARKPHQVPLLAEPPEWWEPYVKPGRDDLLEAVQRVLTLHKRNEHSGCCEHCSARDYPDYEVVWPCPTVQALGDVAAAA